MKFEISVNADGSLTLLQNGQQSMPAYKLSDVRAKDAAPTAPTQFTRMKNPAEPFKTSTLQQEAAKKLGFGSKRTMRLAQNLYEGIELGKVEGSVGLITYMRTDSTRVSDDALTEVRQFIAGERYGPEYLPPAPNTYKSKKDAQDAHEAVEAADVGAEEGFRHAGSG